MGVFDVFPDEVQRQDRIRSKAPDDTVVYVIHTRSVESTVYALAKKKFENRAK